MTFTLILPRQLNPLISMPKIAFGHTFLSNLPAVRTPCQQSQLLSLGDLRLAGSKCERVLSVCNQSDVQVQPALCGKVRQQSLKRQERKRTEVGQKKQRDVVAT
eukprot:766429-Hanusia_phi.AAC.2